MSPERAEHPSQRETEWRVYIGRIAARDEQALVRLYDESGFLVYSVAYRIVGNPEDAEEVTADVYSQVWRQASNFEPGRANAAAWLTMLTRSRAIDVYRSKAHRARRGETALDAADYRSTAASSETSSILDQRRRMVWAAMGFLTEEQREALKLAFFLGYSHSELAAKLGVSLGTVKHRLRSGMQELRARLGPLEESR